jgi:hypothetical protein
MATAPSLREALAHLQQGNWQAAHDIVQREDSSDACWLHGIVHVLEGDLANARYWYARAKRAFSDDTRSEIADAARALK